MKRTKNKKSMPMFKQTAYHPIYRGLARHRKGYDSISLQSNTDQLFYEWTGHPGKRASRPRRQSQARSQAGRWPLAGDKLTGANGPTGRSRWPTSLPATALSSCPAAQSGDCLQWKACVWYIALESELRWNTSFLTAEGLNCVMVICIRVCKQ